ncbi:MAG: hypothetical protein KBG84_09300 [Planctomycetes bacterium]|nr:hypothetical protein [Planctomycetota bacterium]
MANTSKRKSFLGSLLVVFIGVAPLCCGAYLLSAHLIHSDPVRISLSDFAASDKPRRAEITECRADGSECFVIYDERSKRIDKRYVPLRSTSGNGVRVSLLLKVEASKWSYWIAEGLLAPDVVELADAAVEPLPLNTSSSSFRGIIRELNGSDSELLRTKSGLLLDPECKVLDPDESSDLYAAIAVTAGGFAWLMLLVYGAYIAPAINQRREAARLAAKAATQAQPFVPTAFGSAPKHAIGVPSIATRQWRVFLLGSVPIAAATFALALWGWIIFVTNPEPKVVAVRDYDPAQESAQWLLLEGVELDLTESLCVVTPASHVGGSETPAFFVPIRNRSKPGDPIVAFLEISEGSRQALIQGLARFRRDGGGARKYLAENQSLFHFTGGVQGIRDGGLFADRETRDRLSEAFGDRAAPDFAVIAENQKPDYTMPAVYSMIALISGVLSVVIIVKTRRIEDAVLEQVPRQNPRPTPPSN